MTVQTEHVLQKLFSESSLDHISLDRLKQIVDEHPYFTLGHLLLAKKLQNTDAAEYKAQAEKATLYFNEPIWLQSLLHPATENDFVIRERSRIHEEVPTIEEPIQMEVVAEDQVAVETVVEEITVAEPVAEEWNKVETVPEELPVEEIVQVEEPVRSEPREEESSHRLSEAIIEKAEDAPVIFESYHTIDYFASQGIKVSNEVKADDRLSQQLRSFTEWLKTMKRLPETKVDAQLDEVTQQNIQEIAAHSLDQKEVVTESMAEVLVKQNREDEAVAIYEKLSLLNPSKRAYFAAKIEQLKGQ
jgi:hypothetical protein